MVALMVAITIIGFVMLDLLVQAFEKKQLKTAEPARLGIADFRVPMSTFFYPGHTWARIMQTGEVRVGIDDFTRKILGKIEKVEMPAAGTKIKQGEKVFTVKQGERELSFTAPVDGEVTAINEYLLTNPAQILTEPYRVGWILEVKPTNLSTNLKVLKIAEDAVAWFKLEVARFREFALGESALQYGIGETSQDGGCLTEGMLSRMGEKAIEKFEKEFLAH